MHEKLFVPDFELHAQSFMFEHLG